jgi:hypothetical protein
MILRTRIRERLGKRSRWSLTPEQRSESARHAALARWKRQPPEEQA